MDGFKFLFIYLLTMLGLSCCVGYSLAEMSGGYSPVAVCRVLIGVHEGNDAICLATRMVA